MKLVKKSDQVLPIQTCAEDSQSMPETTTASDAKNSVSGLSMDRRTFLGAGAAGSALSTIPMSIFAANDGTFHEAARDIPVAGEYDVIVCGTGLVQSILASALSRAGLSVLHSGHFILMPLINCSEKNR